MRYARQAALPGFTLAAQDKLRRSLVAVVGAGGLGSPALAYLAGAGVGALRIIDSDRVDRSDLGRQTIYREDRTGEPKAIEAAAWLASRNHAVVAEPYQERLGPTNAERLLSGADVVLDCCDNFAASYAVNDYCVPRGLPLVWGAVDAFDGRVGAVIPSLGPCLRCLFGPLERLRVTPQTAGCAVDSAWGPACGAVGALQAGEAIKILTGLGQPLFSHITCLDTLSGRFEQVAVRRDPGCPACSRSPVAT